MCVRSTEEVFHDHLTLAQQGDLETDIARNFDRKCVLLTSFGIFRGHIGVREAAALLERQLGRAQYRYSNRLWHDDTAFLEWSAETARARVSDGADSFIIRDGLIRTMTIHYTIQAK
jgi:hypothetical protein